MEKALSTCLVDSSNESHSLFFESVTSLVSLAWVASYYFLAVGIQIRSDSYHVLNWLRRSYSRFWQPNGAAVKYDFQIITQPNLPHCRLAIQSGNHQYLVYKTRHGFVLCENNRATKTVEIVRFEHGHIYPTDTFFLTIINNR